MNGENNMIKKSTISAVAAMFLLTACGSDNSSPTSSVEDNLTLSGTVVDGYVKGAIVKIGDFETDTDENGAWSISGITFTDNLVIEASGGIDISTGEAFEGVLKAPVSDDSTEVAVTPLSTIVTSVVESGTSIADATKLVSNSLGIDEDTLMADPIKMLSGDADQKAKAAKAIKTALTIQKMAETISKSASTEKADQHIIFDAVMDTVAAKIQEEKENFKIEEETADITGKVATRVNEIKTIKIDNIEEKLKASADAALEVVNTVQDMDVKDLDIEKLNKKAKALEVITAKVEEAVLKIADAKSEKISDIKIDIKKTTQAMVMLGGIGGISDEMDTENSEDASEFATNFLDDKKIEEKNKTYEDIKDANKDVTPDMIKNIGKKIAEASKEDKKDINFGDIVKDILSEKNISISNDKLQVLEDSLKKSEETANETIEDRYKALENPTKVATVADAKKLFTQLRETSISFIDIDDEEKNASTIVGGQENLIINKIKPAVNDIADDLSKISTDMEDSINAFNDSLDGSFDTVLTNISDRFSAIGTKINEYQESERKKNSSYNKDTNTWAVETTKEDGTVIDTLSHTYSKTDNKVTQALTFNGDTITVNWEEDENGEVTSLSKTGAIKFEDDDFTLEITSLFFEDNKASFESSGSIKGDNNSSMNLTAFDFAFDYDENEDTHKNIEAKFDGNIVSEKRTLQGQLTISESNNEMKIVGKYTGVTGEPSFEGTVLGKINYDDLKELDKYGDQTRSSTNALVTIDKDNTELLVIKKELVIHENSNNKITITTQNNISAICDTTAENIWNISKDNISNCTEKVTIYDNNDLLDKVVTVKIGDELYVVGDFWNDILNDEYTSYTNAYLQDFGVIGIHDYIKFEDLNITITDLKIEDVKTLEDYNADLSFKGVITQEDKKVTLTVGIKNDKNLKEKSFYMNDLEVTDGTSFIKLDKLIASKSDEGVTKYLKVEKLSTSIKDEDGKTLTFDTNFNASSEKDADKKEKLNAKFDGQYSYNNTKFSGIIEVLSDEETEEKSFEISGKVEAHGFEPFTIAAKGDDTSSTHNGYVLFTRGLNDAYKLGIKVDKETEDSTKLKIIDNNGVMSTIILDDNEDNNSYIVTDKDNNKLAEFGEAQTGNNWEIKYSDDSSESIF
jgi:hypothetical protein